MCYSYSLELAYANSKKTTAESSRIQTVGKIVCVIISGGLLGIITTERKDENE